MEVAKEVENGELKESDCKEIEWLVSDYYSKIVSDPEVNWEWKSKNFFFNDNIWYLVLWYYTNDEMEIILESETELKCPVQYCIGLKNYNNTDVWNLKCGILLEDESPYVVINLDYDDVSQKSPSSYLLSVICTLKLPQTAVLGEATSPKLINLDKLSDNFKSLFDNKETCDTTLKVKDKEFSAHRSVLIARSGVFAATFKHDSRESQTGIIDIPDCDPDSFQQFLEYLYCGRLEEISLSSALNLYYTSDKYDVQELKTFCIQYLMQCLTVENVCEIAVLADKYDEMELFSAVQEFFNKNCFEIFLTAEWDNLLKEDHRLVSKLLKEMSKMKKSAANSKE